MAKQGKIRVGIGGWTFEPWRGVFYPKGLPHAKELEYASRKLTTIEINGTFYRTQTPATFAKWAGEVPDGFVFSVKGPRYAVNRGVLAEAGDSIKRFLDSGPLEMGDKLGPFLWQFAPTKKFDAADFGKFLELLPAKLGGRKLRHVVEVRHNSFCTPAFIALLREFSIPVVFAEHETYPAIADAGRRLRLRAPAEGRGRHPHRLSAQGLGCLGRMRAAVGQGRACRTIWPLADPKTKPKAAPRDVFVYFIHEGKVRAPAAAMAMIERLGA